MNAQLRSHSWEGLGLWGVKDAQQAAGLSAIHISSTLFPYAFTLQNVSASGICISVARTAKSPYSVQ